MLSESQLAAAGGDRAHACTLDEDLDFIQCHVGIGQHFDTFHSFSRIPSYLIRACRNVRNVMFTCSFGKQYCYMLFKTDIDIANPQYYALISFALAIIGV